MVIKTMREGGIDDALIRESMLQIGYDFTVGSVAPTVNGQTITADSSQAGGWKWEQEPSGIIGRISRRSEVRRLQEDLVGRVNLIRLARAIRLEGV